MLVFRSLDATNYRNWQIQYVKILKVWPWLKYGTYRRLSFLTYNRVYLRFKSVKTYLFCWRSYPKWALASEDNETYYVIGILLYLKNVKVKFKIKVFKLNVSDCHITETRNFFKIYKKILFTIWAENTLLLFWILLRLVTNVCDGILLFYFGNFLCIIVSLGFISWLSEVLFMIVLIIVIYWYYNNIHIITRDVWVIIDIYYLFGSWNCKYDRLNIASAIQSTQF